MIAAAGRGVRFGRPKQLIEIAGKPMLAWSVELFAGMPEIEELVVVTEPEYVEMVEALVRPRPRGAGMRVVAGGVDRQASVANGLAALERVDCVLVHDGARPLVRADEVRRAMALVCDGTASLLATPVVDTIRVLDPSTARSRTLDRATLWAAQTPQLATVADLRRALAESERSGLRGTDEAGLLERIGVEVAIVEGSPENFKVTFPSDVERAAALLNERESAAR